LLTSCVFDEYNAQYAQTQNKTAGQKGSIQLLWFRSRVTFFLAYFALLRLQRGIKTRNMAEYDPDGHSDGQGDHYHCLDHYLIAIRMLSITLITK